MAVCSEIHIKHINTVCGQNVESSNVKAGGTYSDRCTVHIVTTRIRRVKNQWLKYALPILILHLTTRYLSCVSEVACHEDLLFPQTTLTDFS